MGGSLHEIYIPIYMYIFFHFCIKKFSMSSVWNLDKQIKALFKPEMPFSLIETLRKASYVLPGLRLRLLSRATAFAAPDDGFGRTGESLKIAVHTVHLPRDIKSQEHDESRPLRCRSSGRSACVDRRPGGAGKLCQRRRFNASDYII